ncbi:MAG TPA: hypothetical protein VK249_09895 [Anaerolineales bacterium]|nr:hypothetical protein [Anaerolineales bacterium]
MKTRSVFVVALFCVFTIGCNGENRSFEKVIPTPSSMPALTLTSNFTPTPLLTTPQGSAFSPSPISSMTMPQWVTDPKVQILFVPTGTFKEGYKNLTLVNAMTSERFDLQLSADSGDYFWLPDGLHAGMLSRDMPQITLVSMIDGQITSISVPESITRFAAQNLSGPPYPLQASSLHPKDPNFMLLPSWMQLSPDRKYFIYQENYDPKYTSVFEISTNQTIVMTDPNDKYFDLFSEWSPDSRYLAVSQADQEPGMLYHFDSPPTFRLRVYDMNTHQMVASYKDVTFPSWSPDGLKFLFQEWRDWFGESPPCLFDTISGTTKCYYDELIRHKKSNTSQTTFSSIQWSPDKQ